MALVVTAAGGLALLGAVLLLGSVVGSYELDAVLAADEALRSHAYYPWILALLLLGAFTKSAQFPFQFWLPRAMAAPTPVSAYLHSATMVKAGVFLLARLWPVLAGTDEWFWLVGGAGLVTLLFGAYVAMFQNDLKALLAYSTISHLGLITLLLGMNSALAAVAAVFHMMNHATFKASLFMAVGIIDHESGTRDMRRLQGLYRHMPLTGTLAIVACGAMAGVPLLNGFLSKEMFFAETVYVTATPAVEFLLPAAATLAGAFAVVYSLRLAHGVFFGGTSGGLPREPHEPVFWMRLPIEVLVLLCLVVGVLPALSVGSLLETAARPVVGGALPGYSLALWHGVTPALLMSLMAMGAGVALYVRLAPRLLARARPAAVRGVDGGRLFEAWLAGATRAARLIVAALGTRRLQAQLLAIVAIAGLAGLSSAWVMPLTWGDRPRVPVTVGFALLWTVGCACAVGAAWQAKFHRLAALTMLGIVGVALCITYAWFSAPDLALTQLAVEVVTLVLCLLGLRWLPRRIPGDDPPEAARRARWRRRRDVVVAAAGGIGLAALSYALLTREAPLSIAPYYLAHALPEGGGTNVVNVMLVDFRAFDTLGEVTVLGIVAVTVYALLRRFRPPREAAYRPAQQHARADAAGLDLAPARDDEDYPEGYLAIPAVLARLLLPVAFAFAAYLFLRGHDEPGGGFVAGLAVAIAYVGQYMVGGTRWVEQRARLRPHRWIAAGLGLALATGLGSLPFGFPFMTTHTAHVAVPFAGDVHLPSATLFDLGVFAVVVGSTLLVLTSLAHQSLRAARRPGASTPVGAEAEWKS
jgi:multicomponent K+:H+ antiporter subunit A